ncbi:hypothetical protein DC083_01125 [Ignatzschineria ureiclastica]|uniref:Uncharacterized protein n=1 Tax=Ignatzschineria ureiclastica TaxID=472582 RepID=A0A2U2AGP3_9GAMM|nr:hypothetical protein [Ignatzschineria ureiclastica]PWD81825.1 hypothetical protein DC083_01125 [Ignatzschineria ureiclastica]
MNQILFENNKKISRIAGGNDLVLFAIVRRQVWHLSMPGNRYWISLEIAHGWAIILRQLRGYELLISGRSIDLDSQAFPPALNQILFENNKKIFRIAGGNDRALITIVRRQVWHLSIPGNSCLRSLEIAHGWAIILRQLRGYELLISGRSIDLDSQAFPPALNQILFENNKKISRIAGNEGAFI